MATTNLSVRRLRGRIFEPQLLDIRGWKIESFIQQKARLKNVDLMYRGEWSTLFPDDLALQESPMVMNLVQTQMDDLAKLSAEAVPTTVCTPTKETDSAKQAAVLRQGIANTYFDVNNFDLLQPRLVQDLAGAGFALVVVAPDPNSDYPCWTRIDPRKAYPDVWNGQVQDLLVISTQRYRVAARLFPKLQLEQDPESLGWVEVLEYYSKDECIQAVYQAGTGDLPEQVQIVKRWHPGVMPVAYAQLETFDGHFRGLFDQVLGSLMAKNRLLRLAADYMDQIAYAPPVEKGLLNREDPMAPGTMLHLDPTVPDARIERLQPAGTLPQIERFLEYLDKEQRGGTGYPAARQGEVAQSIASASFVASTQGQLTSTVRLLQRLTGKMLEQLNTISFKFDEKIIRPNLEKQLSEPIGRRVSYVPSRDIAGAYQNRVVYGAGAGIDRQAADVRVLQHLGAGLIPKSVGREQIDYIREPDDMPRLIAEEQAENVLVQQLLSSGLAASVSFLQALQGGATIADAAQAALQAQQAEQAAAGAQPPEGAAPGAPEEGGPLAAQAQAQGLQRGAIPVPGAAFALPPLEQVQVRQPSGGRPVQQR